MVKDFKGILPEIGPNSWVSENAMVIGDVEMGSDCSVWFGAIVRGDVHYIKIGDRTNIQDLCVIHVTNYKKPDRSDGYPTIIGNDVTVGHKAMIHGAIIEDACLIGMNSTLLDGCEIGKESIVGAGSVVTKHKKFPPRSFILGSPAKLVRELTEDEVNLLYNSAESYVKYKNLYI
jgi:carbonic anhydrase/acetyltransferase-like protein (isoleucine patch superfamily)